MEILEKSISEKVDLAIAKIALLCNQINRKTEMCCFFEDVAHCSFITVRLHKTKKEYNSTPIKFEESYNSVGRILIGEDTQNRLNNLNRVVEYLEDVLKSKEISYDYLYKETSEIVTGYYI